MRNYNNNILFSATDLNAFIECRHKVLLNFKSLKTTLQKKEDDAHSLLLQKKGLEYEAQYIQSLKESGYNIVEIPSQNTLEKRIAITLDAMKSGADYIFQAALLKKPWHGFADLLERVNQPSLLGPYSYEAVDIKLKRTPEPSHIIQLCVYSDLLKQYQGVTPLSFSLVLGNGEKKTFQFSDFAQYYTTIKRQFEAYASLPIGNSIPSPSSSCSRCKWRNLCNEQWEKDDHLSQVANIQQSQIIKLENNNIQTLESLALLNNAASIPKLSEQTLNRLKSQARLQYNGDCQHSCRLNYFFKPPPVTDLSYFYTFLGLIVLF